jgi:hypothetical protein
MRERERDRKREGKRDTGRERENREKERGREREQKKSVSEELHPDKQEGNTWPSLHMMHDVVARISSNYLQP